MRRQSLLLEDMTNVLSEPPLKHCVFAGGFAELAGVVALHHSFGGYSRVIAQTVATYGPFWDGDMGYYEDFDILDATGELHVNEYGRAMDNRAKVAIVLENPIPKNKYVVVWFGTPSDLATPDYVVLAWQFVEFEEVQIGFYSIDGVKTRVGFLGLNKPANGTYANWDALEAAAGFGYDAVSGNYYCNFDGGEINLDLSTFDSTDFAASPSRARICSWDENSLQIIHS